MSWNRAYRVSGSRVYLTDEGRTWKNAVRLTALDAANRSGWRPLAGPLVVELWLFLGHEMDVDNALKLTLDGLASALRVDDRRFLPRVMGKSVGPGQPEKVVMVVLNEEV